MRRSYLIVLLCLTAFLGAGAVWLRGSGMTSRRHAWPLEERAARAVRSFLMPSAMRNAVNPVPASPEVIRSGMEHFADHCATCHANDGSGQTALGKAMSPRAPDMRRNPTQAMTDGELFCDIENGIPFSGMAAWGTGTADGERSTWELVRFIRHLPQITDDEVRHMADLNPKSTADEKRRKDIDDFLSGTKKIIR
jgi:mono/diheme cytochrome c family protein